MLPGQTNCCIPKGCGKALRLCILAQLSRAMTLPDIPASIQFGVIPPISHQRIVKTCEIGDDITVPKILWVGCPRGQHSGAGDNALPLGAALATATARKPRLLR